MLKLYLTVSGTSTRGVRGCGGSGWGVTVTLIEEEGRGLGNRSDIVMVGDRAEGTAYRGIGEARGKKR